MLLLGLTGSIATGKSTVSLILSNPPYNLPIIDADVLARQVVEPGTPAYEKLVAYFEPTTPDFFLDFPEQSFSSSGNVGRPINRAALGRRIFGDDPSRRRDRAVANKIIHPAVRQKICREILYYFLHGYWAVVLDIPLLFESGWDLLCGIVLVVAVSDPNVQVERLLDRNPELTPEDAMNRVQSQRASTEKAARAEARGYGRGFALWNDGRKEDLDQEIEQVMRKITAKHPRWWAWMLLLIPPLGVTMALLTVLRNWRAMTVWEQRRKSDRDHRE